MFLGIDCSTQSLKGVIIDRNLKVLNEETIQFDRDLPEYKTQGGVYIHRSRSKKTAEQNTNGSEDKHGISTEVIENKQEEDDDEEQVEVTAPSLMFIQALDMLLARLKSRGVDMSQIEAISGSGQQHGTVFWRQGVLETVLKELNGREALAPQFRAKKAFAVENGPIWMDSSTTAQCQHIEAKAGGADKVAQLTGSRCYERFSGPQIRKIMQCQPEAYEQTERISLISSALCCVLVGDYVGVDVSDASGMNLLDIRTHTWSEVMMESTAGEEASGTEGLVSRLGDPVQSHDIVGVIHPYFQQRYGFSNQCAVVAFSGDNPCTLAGLRLNDLGDVAISLGSSDTLFAMLSEPKPSAQLGHVMCSPVHEKGYFAMLCYKNGSLVRESVRDEFLSPQKDWIRFEECLASTSPGNNGVMGLFFQHSEIIPHFNRSGLFFFDGDNQTISAPALPAVIMRALVEHRCLSMRYHSQQLGLTQPKRLIATGGASRNHSILQVLASVFDCPVYTAVTGPNTASLGAAYRAVHALKIRDNHGAFVPFKDIFAASDDTSSSSSSSTSSSSCASSSTSSLSLQARPDPDAVSIYQAMLPRYVILEQKILAMA